MLEKVLRAEAPQGPHALIRSRGHVSVRGTHESIQGGAVDHHARVSDGPRARIKSAHGRHEGAG